MFYTGEELEPPPGLSRLQLKLWKKQHVRRERAATAQQPTEGIVSQTAGPVAGAFAGTGLVQWDDSPPPLDGAGGGADENHVDHVGVDHVGVNMALGQLGSSNGSSASPGAEKALALLSYEHSEGVKKLGQDPNNSDEESETMKGALFIQRAWRKRVFRKKVEDLEDATDALNLHPTEKAILKERKNIFRK